MQIPSTHGPPAADYRSRVEGTVRKYRGHPAILGWALGNEVWGWLNSYYGKPYLTQVRHAYVRFIEDLAIRVKQLDSDHPVFAVVEHSPELPGALTDFANGAPTIDVIGVNCYYEENLDGSARPSPKVPLARDIRRLRQQR